MLPRSPLSRPYIGPGRRRELPSSGANPGPGAPIARSRSPRSRATRQSERRRRRLLGTHRRVTNLAFVVGQAGEVTDWGIGRYERTAEVLLPAARVLVDAASLRTDERVLDLGCGTGNAALLAAAAGAQVTAVDPSPRLLGVASATAQRDGLNLKCERGDAASIPALDATFDCVLSNFAVIFAPDADAAVAEMVRVGMADSRIALTAWLPGGALGALASTAEELVRSAVGAPPATPGFAWHDDSSLRALFSRHGMQVVVQGPHELVISARSPEEFLEAEMANHPLAVAGSAVLRQRGVLEEAGERLLGVLRDHNEDEDAFRSTSRYVVVVARRG